MNRETIEKAAERYAGSINMIYGSKENIMEDFIKGAEWRIDSAWHEASESPENKPTIVEYPHVDGGYGYLITKEPKGLSGSITKWAYLDDLLPGRKEDRR